MFTRQIIGLAALLVLVGGGCGGNETVTPTPEDQPAQEEMAENQKDEMNEQNNDSATENAQGEGVHITKAEPQGDRTLAIEFDLSDEYTDAAEGYRLILSSDEEPTWPTKGYWYQLGVAHTEKEWKGLPLGERQLRACVVIDDACAVYSQTLTVEIE